MSQESMVTTRLFQWRLACDAWGFEIAPPCALAGGLQGWDELADEED